MKEIKLICKLCKKEFISNRKKKYCSDYCRRKSDKEKHYEKRKEYYKQWYAKNGRDRAENYIDVINEWRLNNPEKVLARKIFHKALRDKKIVKKSNCEICNIKTKTQGHHYDYTKPLEVIWVCTSCHKLIHSGRIKIPLDVNRKIV